MIDNNRDIVNGHELPRQNVESTSKALSLITVDTENTEITTMAVIDSTTHVFDTDFTTINPVYDIVFHTTLGICLTLIFILFTVLITLIVYTKYKVWRSKVNISPGENSGRDNV